LKLPEAVRITDEAAEAIARLIGDPSVRLVPLPSSGIINTIYKLGSHHLVRVPRHHPAHTAQLMSEAAAIPVAIDAGVRTAPIVAADLEPTILPVPLLVVERLKGTDLERGEFDPPAPTEAWPALGRDLANLHRALPPDGLAVGPPPEVSEDPRALVHRRREDGWISPTEARWLLRWLERLAPAALEPAELRLVHGDVQMSNVLVGDRGDYVGLIDWGCARVDDVSSDFLAMPMAAVPELLTGYGKPSADDPTLEARIVWRRIQSILAVLPRGAAPGMAWAERPVTWLADLLRFFVGAPHGRWSEVGPP
jgi:aminoglycoside phosphotransferase (APT) family kinase protein